MLLTTIRLASSVALAVFLLSPDVCLPLLRGQDAAGSDWQNLIMEGTYAHNAKDEAKAEKIFLQALHAAERFGPGDQRVGSTLNSLGQVYRAEKKFSDAEAAYRRALEILEKEEGEESDDVANVNFNIAMVLFDQGHQPAALIYLRKALTSYENAVGGTTQMATALCMMGDAYRGMKDYRAAAEHLKRCADIREKDRGLQNPELAEALHSLALTYQGEGQYKLADPRFTLAEKIRESTLGITSPLLAQTMEDHAVLLRLMGREKEAARLTTIAAAIRRNQKK